MIGQHQSANSVCCLYIWGLPGQCDLDKVKKAKHWYLLLWIKNRRVLRNSCAILLNEWRWLWCLCLQCLLIHSSVKGSIVTRCKLSFLCKTVFYSDCCYYLNTSRSPWNKFCKFSLTDALKTLVNLGWKKEAPFTWDLMTQSHMNSPKHREIAHNNTTCCVFIKTSIYNNVPAWDQPRLEWC